MRWRSRRRQRRRREALGATGMWLNTGRMLAAESQAAKDGFPSQAKKKTNWGPFHNLTMRLSSGSSEALKWE